MVDELSSFIDKIYREPYFLFGNNCIRKSLKIKSKAEGLGKKADLICCISIVPIKKWRNLPTINPHMYTEVEGKKIDVSLDPGHEEIYCKNVDKKIILPVNISRLGRIFRRVAGCWSIIGAKPGEIGNGY
jgi:hypothetical protein